MAAQGPLASQQNINSLIVFVFTFKELPLDDRLKAVVYLFEMLLSDELFLDEEDHFFRKVLRDFNISEEQFRHAPAVFLNQPHVF